MTENGRMLGRYQLLFMLGQGGMGEVHLARLTGAAGFEKLCIVKTVLPNLMGDQNFIDRFHHEARVLVQLTHSNIAQVYDMGEVDGTLYMAIEYVPGVDLSRVETRVERQQAQMPIPMAVFIGQKINEALGYAHRKVGADGMPLGIVHRDVSPQNVMVSYEGEVKVIDFGLAKSTARSKHTLPSTVMGKLGYMSPEQALARPVDHRSDIFSAGIVVWEMLAGRSMYAGGTMSEMVAQMAVAEVPLLSSARPDISPTLEQIVMRALAKDPSARYQRADDFARALNELAVKEQFTVGAEDVGNYVRAMCPEEFAAERQLQSKLSVMRRKGAGEVMPEPQAEPELEGTFMRPSGAVAASETASGQVMTPAMRAMSMVKPSTPPEQPARAKSVAPKAKSIPPRAKSVAPVPAQVPEEPLAEVPQSDEAPIAPPQRSKAPLVVVALLAVVALGVGGYVVLGPGRGGGDAVVDAGVQVAAKDPEPVKKDPEPAKQDPEPVVEDPDPKTDPNPKTDPGEAVALEQIAVDGKVWKVLRKNGEDKVILQKGDKVSEGDRVNVVGEPGEDGKRPLYAHGAISEVKGSIAVLLIDDDVKLPEKVYAAKDSSPKRVAKKDPGASAKNSTEPNGKQEPPVKTEPIAKNDPEPAKKDPEPTKQEPEPVKQEEPVKPATTQLFGTVRVSLPNLIGNRAVFVQSQNKMNLTGCSLRLPTNVVFIFGKKVLAANDTLKLPLKAFNNDSRPPDPQFKADWAAIYCNEGTGYWKTTFERR